MATDFQNRFASARRSLIEADFQNLNPMQRQAVLATEGPLLLLAGAGSGKTTVLIHRVANLLRYGRASDTDELPAGAGEEELALLESAAAGTTERDDRVRALCALDPAPPWSVLAITFTNKAAGELKTRLAAKLGAEASDIWALTFHSACARILRRDADRLGFTKSFTIYDQSDSLAVMKRVLKEMDVDDRVWPPKAMLNAACRYKGELLAPEDALAAEQKSGDIRRIRTAQICSAYARRLREADAMDFDDLLYFCVRLLRENADVLAYYQKKFRYVLVDEYQDTNHLQYLMAALLAGGRRNICVVGDDDQSIYKFRGATIENILSFEKQYKDARVIRLEQNYRSTGNILAAANAVIAHNTERKGKNLWTEAGPGELITLYVARSEDDEAEFVARTIAGSRQNPRDFAVLYRTNAQSRSLEQAFKNHQIAYRIFGGLRFFDRAEVKDMLAYLCVIANPTDETRLLRIVNNPPRGIGASGVEKAQELAIRQGKPLFEVLRTASLFPELVRPAKKMEEFAAMITALQDALTGEDLGGFYDELLERTGYVRALEAKNSDEELARIENVYELKSSLLKSVDENGGDLYAFLDEVALYTDLDNYDENADCTVLMTMHAAKGLEFPTVFIVGAEEGLFPGLMAIGEPGEMEEERRLCYVAITRARRQLYITCAAQRMIYGRTNANMPSRFVEEIPAELLERRESPVLRRGAEGAAASPARFRRPEAAPAYSLRAPRPKPRTELGDAAATDFRIGDKVEHTAFGQGVIAQMTPVGGDALVEIDFGEQGTKRLMLRVAARHMKKL